MSDAPDPVDPITAATPPVGVSSGQMYTIALLLVALYAAGLVGVFVVGGPGDRTAYFQSAIGLAQLAAGFYLGSSAGSRNKDGAR